jgi:thiol-disulfide isomerase/thioredoxin
MPEPQTPSLAASRNSFPARLALAAVSAMVGFGTVYALLGREAAPPSFAQTDATTATPAAPEKLPTGPGRNALSTGEMANFVFKASPEALAEITFADASAQPLTLAGFKGRVVLLNLWATWCAPCRKEMPGLDTLQRELGSKDFEVMALSVDRAGAAASQKFLDQIKVQSLKLYVDASARAGSTLKVVGLPATLLLDRQGHEIGRLVGPAHWDSPEARRLIQAALAAGN